MKPEDKIEVSSLMSEVYKRQRDCILSMLRKLTGDDNELAEDILHDAVIKILLWDGRVYGFEHLSVLLTKVTKQLWASYYSRALTKKRISEELLEVNEGEPTHFGSFDYYPISRDVLKRIKKLSKNQQNVIEGTFFKDLAERDYEKEYGIRANAVGATRKQALDNLRKPVFKHGSMDNSTIQIVKLRLLGHAYEFISKMVNLPVETCRHRYHNVSPEKRLHLCDI